jgi:hypothetical protein
MPAKFSFARTSAYGAPRKCSAGSETTKNHITATFLCSLETSLDRRAPCVANKMPTKVSTGIDYRSHPGLTLLLCHCGKWAFRVDSHFPLFDPGSGAERPPVGCPIDWHVVPMPDPPLFVSMEQRDKSILPVAMDQDLVRAIHSKQLLAYEQRGEPPGMMIADGLAFFDENI